MPDQKLGVPKLVDLVKQRLIKNIDMLYDIGDISFVFLAPILRCIQNPDQLLALEQNCPHIRGETGEIWMKFIRRDIPGWEAKPHQPRDPRNWSKVYRKLKKDAEKEVLEQADKLKEQMRSLQQDRAQNKTTIVDSRVGYGARSSRVFGLGGGSGWGGSGAPAKTGKVAMDKLKRGMFDYKRERPRGAQMPSHLLAERKSKLQAAPASMVRVAENEAPQRMLLSKQAAASVAQRKVSLPETKAPHITHRPVPQQSAGSPRSSLPASQQSHPPRPKPKTEEVESSALRKRKAPQSQLFHKSKQRRI